jgi:hypothetical protein
LVALRTTAGPDPVREKFAVARKELSAALIERDEEIDLVLTALVAGEHVLLVGPPGCGKSLLLDGVLAWTGGTKFSILLTKFTVPEECFGPVSIAALKEDRYVRITAGRLPEADFAFPDEVWEASSAILNTLLRILNERTYDAGDGVARRVPLKLAVAASNEWPAPDTGKELSALFDRFVLRKAVAPIRSQAGRKRLLWTRDHTPTFSSGVSPADVEQAWRRAAGLTLGLEPGDHLPRVHPRLEHLQGDLATDGVGLLGHEDPEPALPDTATWCWRPGTGGPRSASRRCCRPMGSRSRSSAGTCCGWPRTRPKAMRSRPSRWRRCSLRGAVRLVR